MLMQVFKKNETEKRPEEATERWYDWGITEF